MLIEIKKEWRCAKCGKLLAKLLKGKQIVVEITCPRCKKQNTFREALEAQDH